MTRTDKSQNGLTLIELLIGMVIAVIVSAMLLLSWFALNRSFVFAVNSGESRDNARLALSRMQREVRDAQQPPYGYPDAGVSEAAIYRASTYWIAFFTTFNKAGNNSADWSLVNGSLTAVPTAPHLVVYRLYSDGKLYRFEDLNHNGVIDMTGGTFDMSPLNDTPAGYQPNEETRGEGASLLLKNVVNTTAIPGSPTPLFMYNYYDVNGHLQSDPSRVGTQNCRELIAVQIHTLVDVNPRKAPVFVDLVSTAQLRNQRN